MISLSATGSRSLAAIVLFSESGGMGLRLSRRRQPPKTTLSGINGPPSFENYRRIRFISENDQPPPTAGADSSVSATESSIPGTESSLHGLQNSVHQAENSLHRKENSLKVKTALAPSLSSCSVVGPGKGNGQADVHTFALQTSAPEHRGTGSKVGSRREVKSRV